MTIGERIKYSREKQGMTLEQLGKHVGVAAQTLSRYETGVISGIPSDRIESIAKALHTTPAYLMGWEEELKEEYTEEELSETKKRLIEKIKDLDEGTIAALNQIADTIIESRQ